MTTKQAIIDPRNQERLRKACRTDRERVLVWLMMDLGMHPHNVTTLGNGNLSLFMGDTWIHYKRAKNSEPMKALVPKDLREPLTAFIRAKKVTTRQYNNIIHKIGKRIRAPDLSPMSLRKTCGINELREFHDHTDRLRLVARRMGCTIDTVTQFYLELHEWEREHGRQG